MSQQPVSDLQLDQLKIEWVERGSIKPNKYNPNKMSWHDRELLKNSLLEDGWTQPIVTLPDGTIVDGEQRWFTSGVEVPPSEIQEVIDRMEERRGHGAEVSESIMSRLQESKRRLELAVEEGRAPCIAEITGGLVPITHLDLGDDAHKVISTIRHNRARGTHQIDAMAGLTQDLVSLGLDFEDLETRLGMDDDEITRFLSDEDAARKLMGDSSEYSQSWEPVKAADMIDPEDKEFLDALNQSAEASKEVKKHQTKLKKRKEKVDAEVNKKIEEMESATGSLTQTDKEKIRDDVEKSIDLPDAPPAPELSKVVFFVTKVQYDEIIMPAIGDDMAGEVIQYCQEKLARV